MTIIVLLGLLIASASGALGAWAYSNKRRGIWSVTCDLRRCLVVIGPEQNNPLCVAQRRALKPLLMRVRHIGMNVIELYGSMTPRRNGRPLEWLDNRALRRALKAGTDFHLICLDDESEIILRSQRPVSEAALSEFISMEEPIALPAPAMAPEIVDEEQTIDETQTPFPVHVATPRPAIEPETSWGHVGALR